MRHPVKEGRLPKILENVFWIFSSLKFAVLVIGSLALGLAGATIIESLQDTPTAQYWVYRAAWFKVVLALLGMNILFVAISRWPWKKKHIPFLIAHAGILILLTGSWITDQWGIDGSLRISEGESRNIVEIDNHFLIVNDSKHVYSVPVPWIPPGVQFKPIWAGNSNVPYDIRVDQFISHADPNVFFDKTSETSQVKNAAIQIRMTGGPMKISQEVWLWQGSPEWKSIQVGPAHFTLGPRETGLAGKPSIAFQLGKDDSLSYVATSSEGKKVAGRVQRNQIKGQVIHPGWKGDVTLTVGDWIPDARAVTQYKGSRVQQGSQAPSSAIHIVAGGSAEVWLGLGDRAILHVEDREVELGYFTQRIVLPFSIRLERFTVEHDQGTLSPAAYSSRVSVVGNQGQKDATISMNEPLEKEGFTIYQASYEEGSPRPITSIFAVNRDPGRIWKYLGSFLIVGGSILLFAAKYRQSGRTRRPDSQPRSSSVEAII